MKIWKRNAVVATVLLFVCVAVYLNWSYGRNDVPVDSLGEDVAKSLGGTTLVVTPDVSDGEIGTPLSTETDGAADSGLNASESVYFASVRLNRQSAREEALSILRDAQTAMGTDEASSSKNAQMISTIADNAVKESRIEGLICAKGFRDCVAFINDQAINVVVSAKENGLNSSDVAKIKDIVQSETKLKADKITILEAKPEL